MDVVLIVANDRLAVHLVERRVYDVRQLLVGKSCRMDVFAFARNSRRSSEQIHFERYEIFSRQASQSLVVIEVPLGPYRQGAISQRKFVARSVYYFESSRQAAFSAAAFRT